MEELTELAREVMTDGIQGLETLTYQDIREIRAFAKPPRACEQVCLAALHLLAGLIPEIPIKKNGSPQNADWSGCKAMMAHATFLQKVQELPSYIDQGKVM